MHALQGCKYYACTEERSQKRREIMVTITRRDLCRLALLSLMVAFDGRSYRPAEACWGFRSSGRGLALVCLATWMKSPRVAWPG